MNPRSPRIARFAGAAVIAALVAVTAATAAKAFRPVAPVTHVTHMSLRGVALPGTTFSTLGQAVANGRVDAGLITRLRSTGSVDAIVSFDSSSILRHAERSTSPGRSRVRRMLSIVEPALHAEKTNALAGTRQLRVLQPLVRAGPDG